MPTLTTVRTLGSSKRNACSIWQDGQSVPLIYNGVSVRRSNVRGTSGTDADGTPLYEIPVGTLMD